jgi:hypothetical protein
MSCGAGFLSLGRQINSRGESCKNGIETDAIWKMQQNAGGSEIKKWLSPTRFILFEESEFKIKEHDPSASLGKHAKVEKAKSYEGSDIDIYRASFDAEGECELLPGDKSRVISTHPVKTKKSERRRYSFATLPPQLRIFAFVPAASASLMLPTRL